MRWPVSGRFAGFDGANASFGDTSLQATSSNVQNVVVYASTDSTAPGRVVFVAINRSTSSKVVAITGQALSGTAHLYQMTAASAQPQFAAGNPVAPVVAGTQAAIRDDIDGDAAGAECDDDRRSLSPVVVKFGSIPDLSIY